MRRTVGLVFRGAGGPFSKPHPSKKWAPDKGMKQAADYGDSFTDPAMYKGHKAAKRIHVTEKVHRRLVSERQEKDFGFGGKPASFSEMRSIDSGLVPSQSETRRSSKLLDEEQLSLRDDGVEAPYTRQIHRASKRRAELVEMAKVRLPIEPRDRQINAHELGLKAMDEAPAKVAEYQDLLARQHGVFAPQRMEAYMVGDESVFPDWVSSKVPNALQDMVKFGNLGITEDDEVLRVNLAKMPMDRRRSEWERIRRAKMYSEGTERPLTPAEIKRAKLGHKQHMWLLRRQRQRQALIGALALSKPSEFTSWPTNEVDHSARLAHIAKHIEAGVETKGEWPLSSDALARARLRKKKEEAAQTFMDPEARKVLANKRARGAVLQQLKSLDEDPQPIKRISRRQYRLRIGAIERGHVDEHGRNVRLIYGARKQPGLDNPHSVKELALAKEVGSHLYDSPNQSRRHIRTKSDGWSTKMKANALSKDDGPRMRPNAGHLFENE